MPVDCQARRCEKRSQDPLNLMIKWGGDNGDCMRHTPMTWFVCLTHNYEAPTGIGALPFLITSRLSSVLLQPHSAKKGLVVVSLSQPGLIVLQFLLVGSVHLLHGVFVCIYHRHAQVAAIRVKLVDLLDNIRQWPTPLWPPKLESWRCTQTAAARLRQQITSMAISAARLVRDSFLKLFPRINSSKHLVR